VLNFWVGPATWFVGAFFECAEMEEPRSAAVGAGGAVPVAIGAAGVRIVAAAKILECTGPIASRGQSAAAAAVPACRRV
jgi:hypothetical protein